MLKIYINNILLQVFGPYEWYEAMTTAEMNSKPGDKLKIEYEWISPMEAS